MTGGISIPWAIPANSDNPDAAAAYIDFITNAEAMTIVTEAGNLPVVDADAQEVEGLLAEVFDAWAQAGEEDLLVPYLDYATETFYDTITAAVQDLLAGQRSPEEFLEPPRGRVRGAVAANERRHDVTATGGRPPSGRPPGATAGGESRRGEPPASRGATSTSCRPSWSSSCSSPCRSPAAVSLSLYEWDGLSDKGGSAGELPRDLHRPELRGAFVHALVLVVFYAVIPVALGLMIAATMMRRAECVDSGSSAC